MMKIQANQLQQALQSGKRIALIDVRVPVEHDEMHIGGSLLMPLDRLDAETVKQVSKGAEQCVIVCGSGNRAAQAFQKLIGANCENLVILEGGVSAWEKAGLPLVRSQKSRLPLMRQVQLAIGVIAFIGSILALTVDKNFAVIPAFLGAGLTFAGSTGWCGLAILLSKMPWNKIGCGDRKVTSCAI